MILGSFLSSKFSMSRLIFAFMGLTLAGGLVMGTRVGDFDPGVILYSLHRLRENLFLEIFVLSWIFAAVLK